MFNAIKFVNDYNIPYWTEGKNVSSGWINIQCPFSSCNDPSNHGGFNPDKGYYICWRCGYHSLIDVIMETLSISFYEAQGIVEEYMSYSHLKALPKKRKHNRTVLLPRECTELKENHRAYLEKRNFDPDFLEKKYQLRGTNHIGNYKFRIIAPIYLDGKLVSYQGRDITGKQIKYKACRKDDEVIHHKAILYNLDNADDRIVIVEGITDVWRLGDGAVATFGVGWTKEQAVLIAQREYKKVFVLFDAEPIAQQKAENLSWMLSTLGMENISIVQLKKGDPGEMKQEDAYHLMEELK